MQGGSERPRELRWQHVAGLLFGDWGTSRLYVLGLAFAMSGASSFWYIVAMCVLVTIVGFCYTIICKHYPDGGGVYSAAKHRSPTLGVIGALLLIADYIITAALSAYEGFRYILPADTSSVVALYAAIASILVIGLLNTVGMRRIGFIALVIAVLSAIFYLVIGIFCTFKAHDAHITLPQESLGLQWEHFVNVILALSGVEAVANMTGVMADPVAKNARRAIFVVLAEILVLNLVMGWAMNALDLSMYNMHDPSQHAYVTDNMVRILAERYVGPSFASISAVIFGFLLLSAANTAIGDMVSIQYMMSRDNELPRVFTSLNRFGMPWVALSLATIVPMVVLWLVGDNTESLADLYAIGVVGAIALNLLVTGTSTHLELAFWEVITLVSSGLLITGIELTIAFQKPHALIFALTILTVGLVARMIAKVALRRREVLVTAHTGDAMEVIEAPLPGTPFKPPSAIIPAGMPRILVPTRGNPRLIKFASGYAKAHQEAVVVLFVREIALAFRERGKKVGTETMTLANDPEAQQVFLEAKNTCEAAGVPMLPLYAVHDSAADLIVDHAATLGVDAVIMGVSRRGALWRTLRGDVIQEVVAHLPESIPLLIHA